MNEFANLEQLKDAFKHQRLAHLGPEIEIDGIPYKFYRSTKTVFRSIFNAGHTGMIVYCVDPKKYDKALEAGLNEWLVFCWIPDRLTIVPGGVFATPKQKTAQPLVATESIISEFQAPIEGGEPITIKPEQLIGDIVEIEFTSFPNSKPVQAKIDTGATICSLDAEEWHIVGENRVQFKSKAISGGTLTMPLKTQHAVKSADGGTHYRPVVELSLKINGKLLENQLFNLNDRANMDQPVLIGQNVLKAGKFFINPVRENVEIEDDVDWGKLKLLMEIDPKSTAPIVDNDVLQRVYETLLTEDIKFSDLVRYIRTQITNTLEEIQY